MRNSSRSPAGACRWDQVLREGAGGRGWRECGSAGRRGVDEGPRSVSEAARADSREQEQASACAAGWGGESKHSGVGGLAVRARASAAARVAWEHGVPGAGGAAGRAGE